MDDWDELYPDPFDEWDVINWNEANDYLHENEDMEERGTGLDFSDTVTVAEIEERLTGYQASTGELAATSINALVRTIELLASALDGAEKREHYESRDARAVLEQVARLWTEVEEIL